MYEAPVYSSNAVPKKENATFRSFWRSNLFLITATILFCMTAFTVAQDDEVIPPQGPHIFRSIPPAGVTTHTVIPGKRFKSNAFSRWLYGSNYRDLWNMPIEVSVLDYKNIGGGIKPFRTGGFGQSISLQCTGADGHGYTVRSLDKDPTKRLDDVLRNTLVEEVVKDMISSQLPTAGLVVDQLMEATGILFTKQTMVVIPDDAGWLGKFREQYAGLIGAVQRHPMDGPGDTPGFANSREITSTKKLWPILYEGPVNQIDTRVFLKAKLFDFFIGDKDRHAGQWRWARYPKGDRFTWIPIPEDRDQAFIDYDGLVMALVRRAYPRFIRFKDTYPSHKGLTRNGWEIDREFLNGMDKSVWDSTVTVCQGLWTDQVIDDAVKAFPAPIYERVGAFLTDALKQRRDDLQSFADKYYALITREPEITTTNRDEYADLEHLSNGNLSLKIGVLADDGSREAPFYNRTFLPGETREVRLYLQGGNDRVEIKGGNARIKLRIDGGAGDDTYVNASRAGGGKTQFFDAEGNNSYEKGKGAKVNEAPFERIAPGGSFVDRYSLDWGNQSITYPLVNYSPDLGAYAGFVNGREYFGYRKYPYASRHQISAGIASNGPEPLIAYSGTFRDLWSKVDGKLHLEYSGINVIRFHGLGNGTEIPRPKEFYEVDQKEFIFAPGFRIRIGSRGNEGADRHYSNLTAEIGALVKYANTPAEDNTDKFIGTFTEAIYGTGTFGQAGVRGALTYDTRDNPSNPKSGVHFDVNGVFYPELWDVAANFGNISGTAAAYLSVSMPAEPTLAVRVGGKKVWGTFPFHEAAYVGGPKNLRGFRQDRFGGDAAAFGNAELRFRLTRMKLLVPGELGVFGAADAGRVYLDGDLSISDDWHTGFGGGIWVSFLRRMQTLSLAYMSGDDLNGVYLRAGFMF